MTETTRSTDGTTIAFDREGNGPALVIVGGAFNTRFSPGPLVGLLSDAFTVITWDRRGRGGSGNTLPYATERELEDLAAVIEAVGGSAFVYGHSSGAILALDAAASGAAITKLAVYEPPYVPVQPGDNPMDGVQRGLDAGDNDGAARAFLLGTGMPETEGISHAPFWPAMVAIAPTLPYDLALAGDGEIPLQRLAKTSVPVLIMDGGNSPAWAAAAAVSIAEALPTATRFTVDGQDHGVAPDVLAPILREFFA